jgi:hypothetical protein
MNIRLINQSSSISDAEVKNIAAACAIQLANDVGPAWGISEPLTVTVGTVPEDSSSYPFFLVDTIPDVPGALAYHYVQPNGVPAGKIAVQTTIQAGETVASATSHEAVELQCDEFCASWSFSTRLSCLVATEACDPVQGDTYNITVAGSKVPVSNFVTPYYFTDNPLKQTLDHLGNLSQSFDISPGGYQIRMKGGKTTNVYGPAVSAALRKGKEASQGRTFWRHVTMALALSA